MKLAFKSTNSQYYRLIIAFFGILALSSCGPTEEEKQLAAIALENEKALYKDSLFHEMEQVVFDWTDFLNEEEKKPLIPNCGPQIRFDIKINKLGKLLVRGELNQPIISSIKAFYKFNRKENDLTSNYPLYSRVSRKEIRDKIEREVQEINRMKLLKDPSADILNYHYEEKKEWELRLVAIKTLKLDELPEPVYSAQIHLNYNKDIPGQSSIRDSALWAYYELRNEVSLHYFKKSYVDVYMNFKKTNSTETKNQLNALEILYPIRIIDEPNIIYHDLAPPEIK